MVGMPDWFWWVAGAGIIVALVARWWLGARRDIATDKAARRLGLRLIGSDKSLSPDYFLGVPLFQAGHSAAFLDVMRGQIDGAEALLFDYRHTVGDLLTAMTSTSLLADVVIGYRENRAPTVYNMTVAAFRVPPGAISQFELRQENVIDRMADAFKGEDIDFPEHTEFSKRFLLRGPNPDRIRRMFDPRLLDFLTGQKIPFCVEASGDWLVVYPFGQRVPVKQLAPFWSQARGIRNILLEGAQRGVRAPSHA